MTRPTDATRDSVAADFDSAAAGVIPVIPVGPGDADRRRLRRLVAALVRHEPDLATYIVVIDGIEPADIYDDLKDIAPEPILVANPRTGPCVPQIDGLGCGLATAYACIAKRFPGHHAWKLDTDAYVIGPCRDRIAAYFVANPSVGMAGTTDVECDGTPSALPARMAVQVITKFLRPLWYWRIRGFTSPHVGRWRKFARWIRAADAAGLKRGRFVQGGSYAIRAGAMRVWADAGKLDRPRDFLGCPMGEDVAFSMWTVAAGFELGTFNQPGDVFGVRYRDLPLPTQELVTRGYGVVHSVKAETWEAEEAIVAEFDC